VNDGILRWRWSVLAYVTERLIYLLKSVMGMFMARVLQIDSYLQLK